MSVESELILGLKNSFLPMAINKITMGVKAELHEEGFSTSASTKGSEPHDEYHLFSVSKKENEEDFIVRVEIHFIHGGREKNQGFCIYLNGNLNFGRIKTHEEWQENFPELEGLGGYKDFVNLIENYCSVDFCVEKILCFYDSLKEKSYGQH